MLSSYSGVGLSAWILVSDFWVRILGLLFVAE